MKIQKNDGFSSYTHKIIESWFWTAKMLKLESAKKNMLSGGGMQIDNVRKKFVSRNRHSLECDFLDSKKKHNFHILESDCFQIPKSGFFLLFDSDFFLILKACFFVLLRMCFQIPKSCFFLFFKSVFRPDSKKHVFVNHRSIKTIFPPPYPKTT